MSEDNKIKKRSNAGRPTKMTEAVLSKLNEAFALGCRDEEACFYADISHQTLYDYQKKHPEYVERKARLKERPILIARQELIKGLTGNPDISLKYLERKLRDEFGTVVKQENVNLNLNVEANEELSKDFVEYLKSKTKQQI